MHVEVAMTQRQIAAAASLFREYAASLPASAQLSLEHQGFEAELASLPGRYAPPQGCILIAVHGSDTIGVVAMRPLDPSGVRADDPTPICEMKRVYVRPTARGLGAGKALAVELLDFFDGWKPLEALKARLGRADDATLRRAVAALEQRSLLQRSDRPRPPEAGMEGWSSWNPAAGLLHFSTKDVPYVGDYELGERQLRRQARTSPMPAASKRTPRSRMLRLPPPRAVKVDRGQVAEPAPAPHFPGRRARLTR